ncbi:MAG: phage holin family protein [Burkholderiales bacterium]
MTEPSTAPGLAGSLRRLARTALGLVHTRLEIAGTELEEEGVRFTELVLAAIAAAFCLQIAVTLAVAFIVVLLWDSHPLAALGGFAVLFLLAAAFLAHAVRTRARNRPKLFGTTLGELARDLERLGG